MFKLGILIGLLIFSPFIYAQKMWEGFEHLMKTPRSCVVYQTLSEIEIDGKPDEISWQKAEWSETFKDIEGDLKPDPLYQTRMKMLWDKDHLYILAELEDPHIWTYYANDDQMIYHENDFEIFIDPDKNTHNYFEFGINAQNALLDLFMPKPFRNGGNFIIDWNMRGFKSAVFIDGTLNNAFDIDKKWTVEIAIPFKYLTDYKKFIQPKDGSWWKINFSRDQWQTEAVSGRYLIVNGKNTNKPLPANNWAWSPQGVVDMHFPERWGLAWFSSKKVGGEKVIYDIPEKERLGKYLWFIYYKQQNYKIKNLNYAVSLSELGLHQLTKTNSGEAFLYEMKVNGSHFIATLTSKNGFRISINQEGLFQIINE
jgi:hypothetical protein